MAEKQELEITNIAKIHIGKGDMLAIQSDIDLTASGRDQLIASVKLFLEANGLKDVPIMVLDRGLRVVVVHREEGA